MTVTITSTNHDIPQTQTDDNDNGTCCSQEYCDHTQTLLEDLIEEVVNEDEETCKIRKSKLTKMEKIERQEDANCKEVHRAKSKWLLDYDNAPEFMKHNIYIRTGYRGMLNTKLCFDSIFWWTNETINIWSHIFGLVLFTVLSIRDINELHIFAFFSDKIIVAAVLLCFQICMLLSAVYHTFCCKSEQDCDFYLALDLFGIALSLYTIYISGIYYAFWCEQGMQNIYMITVSVFFLVALALQIPSLQVNSNIKTAVFVAWAAYGVVPTLHWAYHMGGLEHPLVRIFIPKIVGMYTISGIAFLIYITKIPERFFSGKFDYLGHSHQWWHILVVYALYYWHNGGIVYLEYRMNHACPTNLRVV